MNIGTFEELIKETPWKNTFQMKLSCRIFLSYLRKIFNKQIILTKK